MSAKKLMVLGGLRYAVPVVQTAHRLWGHFITTHRLPDNATHRVPHECCNVANIIHKMARLFPIHGFGLLFRSLEICE